MAQWILQVYTQPAKGKRVTSVRYAQTAAGEQAAYSSLAAAETAARLLPLGAGEKICVCEMPNGR